MSKILRKLDDPIENDSPKLSCVDQFELVYMRHWYFRKSTNPEPVRLAQFEEMLCKISDKHYMKSFSLYKEIGFEMDDLRNIARVNVVSFISLSGLQENPDKMKKFVKRHKSKYGKESEPKARDLFLKECYDLAKFLDQRIGEIPMFCERKMSSVRGSQSVKRFYAGDPTRCPSDLDLYHSPETFGYSKITEVEYKKLVKKSSGKGRAQFLDEQNRMIRAVYIKGSFLTPGDIEETSFDSGKSSFYRTPEENIILKEFMLSSDKDDQLLIEDAYSEKLPIEEE